MEVHFRKTHPISRCFSKQFYWTQLPHQPGLGFDISLKWKWKISIRNVRAKSAQSIKGLLSKKNASRFYHFSESFCGVRISRKSLQRIGASEKECALERWTAKPEINLTDLRFNVKNPSQSSWKMNDKFKFRSTSTQKMEFLEIKTILF